jgi:23S rRNA (pseudouridine1915-N3)-methyltransferase
MKITIIQIGKTKHSFVLEAEQEYLKRLHPQAKIDIITLKESPAFDHSSSPTGRQKVKAEEAEYILKNLRPATKIIALDEHGRQFTSTDFAAQIGKFRDFEGADLTFIIGGPFGLDQSILDKAHLILSFSKFTFTHEMIRMLLLEQLYRAFSILQNKTYHY